MLGHVYVLAEKFGSIDTKCFVVSAKFDSAHMRRHRYCATGSVGWNIYAGTKRLDPMKKFLTNMALLLWHEGWVQNATIEYYHPEYLAQRPGRYREMCLEI